MTPKENEVDPLDAALAAEVGAPSGSILSAREIDEAKAEAKKRVLDAQKKKAKAALIDEETRRLQQEEGFSADGGVMGEIVRVTLDLAPHQPHITLDGTTYLNGQTYPVTRSVAATLRETQQRGWQHQDQIDGKSIFEEAGRRAKSAALSGAAYQ